MAGKCIEELNAYPHSVSLNDIIRAFPKDIINNLISGKARTEKEHFCICGQKTGAFVCVRFPEHVSISKKHGMCELWI